MIKIDIIYEHPNNLGEIKNKKKISDSSYPLKIML